MNILIQSLPLLIMPAVAAFILLIGAMWRRISGESLLIMAVAGLVAALFFGWQGFLAGTASFPADIIFDKIFYLTVIIIAIALALAMLVSYNYLAERKLPWPEYLALLLFAGFGAGLMAAGTDFIVLFIGLETISIAAYVLAGYTRDGSSKEASIKYFLMGAFASAVLLFGIAFFYGATGSVLLSAAPINKLLMVLALALIISGTAFKVAAFPFQWWTPDVYEGSPLPVTAFFATAVKAAAFIMLFRIVAGISGGLGLKFESLLIALSVATMTFGNLAALFQENIKRMLAYSSIAHAGYMLIAFVVLGKDANLAGAALLFYILAYIVMSMGAFGVLIYLSGGEKEFCNMPDVAGLGRRSPWLAAVFGLFLLSLAGFPPTAGFVAKFYLFKSAMAHGYVLLVIAAVINSLISVYYYMRPVVAMYFGEFQQERSLPKIRYSVAGVLIFCAIFVIILGLAPATILAILSH
ncbi:MAG: NADH-quinone oxidoreductase subunit N [Deltaproteobacteria bacterium]|nr:NADH-quinone oxidoreductase subunit N [Deltaproteobacteria bacterium]